MVEIDVYISDQSISYSPEPMKVFEGPILIINQKKMEET